MSVAPGWYKDPAEPTTQRYWDGEGWIGDPIPDTASPPPGPPPASTPGTTTGAPPVLGPAASATEPGSKASAGPHPGPHPAPGWPPRPGWPTPGAGWPPPGPDWAQGPARPQLVRVLTQPRVHGLALANPGARLVARLVDALILLALNAAANGYFLYQYWLALKPFSDAYVRKFVGGDSSVVLPEYPTGHAYTLELTILVISLVLWFIYEVPSTASGGQTPGKRLLGIKVVRLESAEPLGIGRAWRRWNPLAMPTLLWQCCGVGFLLQAADCFLVATDRPLYQAIHDKLAGTVVVQADRPAGGHTAAGPTRPAGPVNGPVKGDTRESSDKK